MPSPITQAGGLAEESNFAPLHTNRFMTGLWTNRNPLRDAATPFLYEKFYSAARYDSLLGGLNAELTPKMTMKPRRGHSVYNSQNFPALNSFYSFRTFSTNSETIRLIADAAANVYDATGPNRKLNIWNKAAGSGDSYFQSVGNTLFWGDGVSQKKWVQSATTWTAATRYTAGATIVDSNNNLQVAFGAVAANILTSEVMDQAHPPGTLPTFSDVILTLDVATVPFVDGQTLSYNNLTAAPFLNGQMLAITLGILPSTISVRIPWVPARAAAPETGITYALGTDTLTGQSGGAQPAWAVTPFLPTVEGTTLLGQIVWICKGSATQNWGIDAPTTAPVLIQLPLNNSYPAWAANTYYATQQVFVTGTLLIQLYVSGTTAAIAPVFSPVIGAGTVDGTAKWLTLYNGGTPNDTWPAATNLLAGKYTTSTVAGTSYVFLSVQGGVTGATVPAFSPNLGAQTADGSVVWQNVGALQTYASIGASTAVSKTATILDPTGYAQTVNTIGVSGGAAPAWNDTSIGALTTDNTMTWINAGAVATAAVATTRYAYAYGSSVTKGTSTAGPRSAPILLAADKGVLVQGAAPTDPQDDLIYVYRTARGGSTLFYADTIPAPANATSRIWTYFDSLPDKDLNELLPAAVASSNNPPPAGFRPLVYHLNRIFGAVGNVLSWSNGANQTGNPNQSFTPSNNFTYPSKIINAWTCTLGLIVNTVSDVYIVLGSATDQDPLYTKGYIDGLGILSPNAFVMNKTTPYLMSSVKQVIALDPSSGIIEPGFPIADLFDAEFDAATVQMAWHEGAHGDTALYVGDGIDSWYRLAALAAPETGMVWSTKATMAGGYSAMASVETSPGNKQLLFGPPANGPILFRDTTVRTDNGVLYPWHPVIGSVVLAQPGQIAEIGFITLEGVRSGTQPTIGVLLGEIGGGTASSAAFETLFRTRQDPPLLPPSTTLFSDRYAMMQNQNTVLCRHLQLRIDYPAEAAENELLTYTIYGALHSEAKSQ